MLTFSVQPIGVVRSPRTEPIDDDWGAAVSRVELDGAQFTEDSPRGLAEFSHVELVYVFDRVDRGSFELGARRPRNNPDWPEVGVFAQRNTRRPNRLGIGTCEQANRIRPFRVRFQLFRGALDMVGAPRAMVCGSAAWNLDADAGW